MSEKQPQEPVAPQEDQDVPQNGVVVYRESDETGYRVTWGIIGEIDPMAVPALLRRAARDAEATLGVG